MLSNTRDWTDKGKRYLKDSGSGGSYLVLEQVQTPPIRPALRGGRSLNFEAARGVKRLSRWLPLLRIEEGWYDGAHEAANWLGDFL